MESSRMRKTKGYLPDHPVEVGTSKNLPTLRISENDLPEIKNWKVGSKYKLTIEVEQIELRKVEYAQGEPIVARFRVTKIKSNPGVKGKKGYA